MKSIKINLSVWLTSLITVLSLPSYCQSQGEMNFRAGEKYKRTDRELNIVYQKILKEYAAQPAFILKLKSAQKLWVQLRDAELGAMFPDAGHYGSVEPMCKARYLESLTKVRIKFLKVWQVGIPEGDACNGSVKTIYKR